MAGYLHPGKLYKALAKSTKEDLQRTYLFKCIFPDHSDLVTYMISNTGTPTETSETRLIPWLSCNLKIAGLTTYQDWVVTVKDMNDGRVYNYFYAWRDFVYHKEAGGIGDLGTSGVPPEYKKAVILELLSTDGTPTSRYVMRGAFPLTLGSTQFDYSSDSFMTFQVTFALDSFEWEQMAPPGGGKAFNPGFLG